MVDIAQGLMTDPDVTSATASWTLVAVNPKYYGVPWTTVVPWRKPAETRRLRKAAGQAHAGTLLRVDNESRKKGKYDAMEKELFALFKARRARGRKASARWLTHTARHLLKKNEFKGGRSWRQRFRSRFNISVRKKTN